MPINVNQITDNQVQEVLNYNEGHFLDVKAKEIKPGKLTKTISAFANADGGEIYVGISERTSLPYPHKWDGFADTEDGNGHIQVFEKLYPLSDEYSYTYLSHPKHTGVVLQVIVRKSRKIIKALDGTVYIRRGPQNIPVNTSEALARLERNKGITSFENEPVGVELKTVSNSETTIGFMLQVVPSAEPEPWLKKQEVVRDGKPTVAGVVLFADLPQAILPKSTGIKIYRYKTSDAEGTRETMDGNPLTVEGCAYDLIRDAVAKTKEIIESVSVTGAKVQEKMQYPVVTLHEFITNAVLHRDYSFADDIHIRIFDNRVEIQSPGTLPAHITPQNILAERFSRNGNIVRLINKFPNPPNKDVGEGLNTAFAAMRSHRLKEPVIVETENSVVVHIKHEKLASAEDTVMEYLSGNPSITNQVARELTGISSENSMKGVFLRMRKKELIEPVPGRKSFRSAWRKKQPNGNQKAKAEK